MDPIATDAPKGIPVITISLVGGGKAEIHYRDLDHASGAMQHFISVLRRPKSRRTGVYIGTQATLNSGGMGEIPTVVILHSEIQGAALMTLVRRVEPAAGAD